MEPQSEIEYHMREYILFPKDIKLHKSDFLNFDTYDIYIEYNDNFH
jgi:hypothetical protein